MKKLEKGCSLRVDKCGLNAVFKLLSCHLQSCDQQIRGEFLMLEVWLLGNPSSIPEEIYPLIWQNSTWKMIRRVPDSVQKLVDDKFLSAKKESLWIGPLTSSLDRTIVTVFVVPPPDLWCIATLMDPLRHRSKFCPSASGACW